MSIEFEQASFRGTAYQVDDLDSVAILFAGKEKRGIYRLSFENGEAYVGQAVDVVRRFANHHRRWDDIVGLEFFPVPEPEPLLAAERILIAETERVSPVRNVVDTKRPYGDKDYVIEVAEGSSISLPWDRSKRTTVSDLEQSTSRAKFFQLARRPDYFYTREIAGWFIHETIPDPVATEGKLWTVTAMPSTNRQRDYFRTFCISTGNIEVMVGEMYDGERPQVWINTERNEDLQKYYGDHDGWQVDEVDYPIAETTRWTFNAYFLYDILAGTEDFPARDAMVESAYALNVRMMRHGGTMYRRFHSAELATDLLGAAAKWGNPEWCETLGASPDD